MNTDKDGLNVTLQDMIRFIDDADVSWTEWEIKFFEGIKRAVGEGRLENFSDLSPKQNDRIMELFDKARRNYGTEGYKR